MQKRTRAFLYLVLILVGLVILAAGLPTLRFQAGLPIPGGEGSPVLMGSGQNFTGISFKIMIQTILGLGFIVLLGVVMVNLLRKADWKVLGRLAISLAAVALLMYLVGLLPLPAADLAPQPPVQIAHGPGVGQVEAVPIGDPPAWLITLIIVACGAGAAGLGGWLLYKGLHPPEEDALAREAAAALRAIQSGQDLRDVILNCYLRMTEAVKSGRGIEREEGMTPREFEEVLRTRGVPSEPIHQLTALFEKARYSRQKAERQEEAQAVACLTAILRACTASADAGGNRT